MNTYRITMIGESREVYLVEAESAQDARDRWTDGTLILQESSSMEIYNVEEDD